MRFVVRAKWHDAHDHFILGKPLILRGRGGAEGSTLLDEVGHCLLWLLGNRVQFISGDVPTTCIREHSRPSWSARGQAALS